MAVRQLSDGNPSGTTLGQSATDLVSFYGAAPVAQPAVISAITTTQPTATVFGFSTTAQFNNLIAAVNTLIANQKTLGLQATA
jgi:hypothetical protein